MSPCSLNSLKLSACRVIALFCFFFTFAVKLNGDEPSVSIQFSTLSWGEAVRSIFFFNNEELVEHSVPNATPGRKIEYSGSNILTFYKKTGIDEDGEIIYSQIAEIDLPITHGEVLLIFVREPGKNSFRILPIPIESEQFGSGSYKFHNLTQRRVAIRLGEQTFIIEPGKNRISQIEESHTNNVEIQIAATQNGLDWHPLYQSRWGIPGIQRRIWVFIHDVDGLGPRINRYYERVR